MKQMTQFLLFRIDMLIEVLMCDLHYLNSGDEFIKTSRREEDSHSIQFDVHHKTSNIGNIFTSRHADYTTIFKQTHFAAVLTLNTMRSKKSGHAMIKSKPDNTNSPPAKILTDFKHFLSLFARLFMLLCIDFHSALSFLRV